MVQDEREPVRSRPWMPGYGVAPDADGLLDWSWATSRIASQRSYWICTVNADRSPHAAPVWGVWLGQALFFSTGAASRKYANLVADPRCVVAVDRGDEALMIEGTVTLVGGSGDPPWSGLVGPPYEDKYGTDLVAMAEPLFRLSPAKVVAQIDREGEFTRTATRWTWPS